MLLKNLKEGEDVRSLLTSGDTYSMLAEEIDREYEGLENVNDNDLLTYIRN